MPTFLITGPDGSKYNVTGDTPEGALQALQQHVASPAPAAPKDVGNQPIDASTVYVDEMLGGLPGKAAAGLNALVRAPFTDKSIGEEYDTLRGQYNNAREKYAIDHPIANTAASIGGAIHGGATLGAAASGVAAEAAPALAAALDSSFAGRMATDAASGAAQGAVSAYGHDQNIGTGSLIGGVMGGLTRPIVSAGGSALKAIGGLVGVGNGSRASSAVAEALARSGQTPQDIGDALSQAASHGQPEYMVADAMGNAGQRMLTGIARSPGDMRQTIAETLQARQAGQGRRLSNALTEGFGTPRTALQTEAAQAALRRSDADVNYSAARAAATPVDPTAAIQHADDFLQPGATRVMSNATNIADDSVEAAVRRARGYLTDGNSMISDFDAARRAKIELDGMIENGNNSIRSQLIPIRNALDDSLANSSQPYANARDAFRQQSQALEATDTGRNAAMRGRVEDTVPAFNAMRPDEQQGFRAGYVDPYIADIQKAAGPMTNKARPLVSDATAVEFPAFAQPGHGQQLMDRIGREQRMFETTNTALGGSRTADNAADIGDVAGFDPTMIGHLASGNIKGAALYGLTRAVQATQGRNQQTRDLIARALLQTSPTQATSDLAQAVVNGQRITRNQEAVIRGLIAGSSTEAPRLQAY